MKITSRIGVAVLTAATITRCSSGADDVTFVPDADLTGVWMLTADPVSPPTTLACRDGHSGRGNMPLCSSLDVDLQESGGVYAGTSSQIHCGADFSASVTVDGSGLSGEIVSDDGLEVQRFTFTGTVFNDTAIIEPGTLSVDGLTGDCTVTGFYNAIR